MNALRWYAKTFGIGKLDVAEADWVADWIEHNRSNLRYDARVFRWFWIALVLLSVLPAVPKRGQCPSGYTSEAGWCLPSKGAGVAVPKGRHQCPSSMVQSGDYCVMKR